MPERLHDLASFLTEFAATLAAGMLAGIFGAVARLSRQTNRRCSLALFWELPSGCALGTAGIALGGAVGLNLYGQFLCGFVAGFVGVAVVHDIVQAAIKHYVPWLAPVPKPGDREP